MEYTVKKLATLAGVSTRTLRYYDEIGILKPARINSSGYRIYGPAEVNILQQIMFYRELGVELDCIKQILSSPSFDQTAALEEHLENLLSKRAQLNVLIENVRKTIATEEGRMKMTDKEKFEGFKDQLIEENEQKYGEEIRLKYGDATVDKSNNKLKNMTQNQYYQVEQLGAEVLSSINEAFKTGDPGSEIAQKAADLHRQWLSFYWDHYTKEAHAGLAQMYVEDERFTAYYDKENKGTAEFLKNAILIYTGQVKADE
ncbi:MerR family transcriptional regulator [Metabacillus litoralis]|uniref:MerR family transcriptional regulator n=1 Tax=Metabacillus TaxID=2675233 RepID=UPI000EF600DC|nr:MerR family transcriptional regulator [Metabacillus litoralis]MCM3162962.1 MerR family transcriptional regulator [Metabacillus litoralis]MCM3410668.1 MerR family transcriptional regulator [Metabacillus litoralis]